MINTHELSQESMGKLCTLRKFNLKKDEKHMIVDK